MAVQNLPTPEDKDLQRIASAIKQLAQGRSNGVGTFTLTASAASTTVTSNFCTVNSIILYMPTTANASAEIGNGTIYIKTSDIGNKTFKVTHANNAQVDRVFLYIALG